jgi:hypothetical protein
MAHRQECSGVHHALPVPRKRISITGSFAGFSPAKSSVRMLPAEKGLLRCEAVDRSWEVNPVTGLERNASNGHQCDLTISAGVPALRPKGRTTNVGEPEMLSSFGVIFPGK